MVVFFMLVNEGSLSLVKGLYRWCNIAESRSASTE